jgi:hypothetical protein
MPGGATAMLAWIGSARSDPDPAMIILGVLTVGAVLGAIAVYRGRQNRARLEMEQMRAEHQRRAQQSTQSDRDEKVYQQHVALNDLTARKIELETRLMQAQADSMDHDRRAREQNEEYHRLMVEKVELEIQSLKLHIREQKKRNEDFTSYDDE